MTWDAKKAAEAVCGLIKWLKDERGSFRKVQVEDHSSGVRVTLIGRDYEHLGFGTGHFAEAAAWALRTATDKAVQRRAMQERVDGKRRSCDEVMRRVSREQNELTLLEKELAALDEAIAGEVHGS